MQCSEFYVYCIDQYRSNTHTDSMNYPELDVSTHRASSPPWLYSATELPRVAAEASSLGSALPWLATSPQGDGHTVMTLPGFTASDWSTTLLRRFLGRCGYRPRGWSLGRNTGALELQDRLVTQFLKVSDEAGTPISLIGQSLGGVFSRELARRFPERVRQVICLGSPFGMTGSGHTNPLVHRLFVQMSGATAEQMREEMFVVDSAEAPEVPCTAVYSRFDGVVAWQTCLERDRPQTDNIEVVGSHIGMALHPAILHAVADRLTQAHGHWQRFDRSRGLRSLVFPTPQFAPG
ncbi:MAG: esterase/lipase family protein [Pseudomonadales bacterium]